MSLANQGAFSENPRCRCSIASSLSNAIPLCPLYFQASRYLVVTDLKKPIACSFEEVVQIRMLMRMLFESYTLSFWEAYVKSSYVYCKSKILKKGKLPFDL